MKKKTSFCYGGGLFFVELNFSQLRSRAHTAAREVLCPCLHDAVFSGRTKLAVSLAKYGFAPRCVAFYGHFLLCGKKCPRSAPKVRLFAFPFLFKRSAITGKEAKANAVCKSKVRATSVSVFFFKTPTQKWKMLLFASCCAACRACNGTLRGSKGY